MTICFISDLHLTETNPTITQLFIQFLNDFVGKINALYILGDLFEYWIGDDNDTLFHQYIISALQKFTSQTPLYLMHGNRDFLLGQHFSDQVNGHLLPDPFLMDLYGRSTLLTHGDNLCTKDKRHQLVRKIMRNKLVGKLFIKLPLLTRKNFAEHLRKKSRSYTKTLSSEIMDVPIEEIHRQFHLHRVHQIIHGHTHRPSIEYIKTNPTLTQNDEMSGRSSRESEEDKEIQDSINQWKKRIVLSDWHNQGNVLICKSDGSMELIYFNLDSAV